MSKHGRHNDAGNVAFRAKQGLNTHLVTRGQFMATDTRFERMVDVLSPARLRHEKVARPCTIRKFSWED